MKYIGVKAFFNVTFQIDGNEKIKRHIWKLIMFYLSEHFDSRQDSRIGSQAGYLLNTSC